MDGNFMSICPLCQSNDTIIVYQNKNMSFGILRKKSTIDLLISYCKKCTFIFQSSAYTEEYDLQIQKLYSQYFISNNYNFPNRNVQHIAALRFLDTCIENEITYNVLEIGSNRGDFLFLLKEKYQNINILGCEPTKFSNLNVPTINAFYNKDLFNTKFDLIILRHTLEHIKNPRIFLAELEKSLTPKGVIFIEVPHILNSLKKSIEDFTPDHVNYFTPQTLSNLFSSYSCLKYDEPSYLYMLFSKKRKHVHISSEGKELELIKNFNNQISAISQEIQNYNRIIFYGIGNYYLWTYSRLSNLIKDKELFFMDDNLDEDKLFHLQKVKIFKNNDLVILCSSNLDIRKQMQTMLPNHVDILYPWNSIQKLRSTNNE